MKNIKIVLALILLTMVTNIYSQTPFSVMVSAGYNSPFGDFSNQYKGGASVEAGICYSLPFPGLDLTLTGGYNGFKYKGDYFTGLVSSKLGYSVSGFSVDWTATDIPFMVGGRFKIPGGNAKPYVTGEIGIHFMSFKDRFNGERIIGNSSNPTTLQLNGATESGSEIGVGYSIGGGIEIPVVPKINLDLNVKYNYADIKYSKSYNVFLNNNTQFTTSEIKGLNNFTIRGGIIIDF